MSLSAMNEPTARLKAQERKETTMPKLKTKSGAAVAAAGKPTP